MQDFSGLQQDDTYAVIAVADQGGGVPDDELDRIFEPFYRATTRRDDPGTGSGLGLAIAARAIALNDGSVVASNRAGGLCVEIRLPR